MGFSKFVSETRINEMEDKIAVLLYLSQNESLNESDIDTLTEVELVEGINDWLGKVGMKLHKSNGLLNYAKQFATGVGKIILAAISGDKEKVKEIAKGLDKATVVDFLLKLDMATMHVVTGPIHLIDAVTGWDLMANIKSVGHSAGNLLKDFYDAITKVKTTVKHLLSGENQQKILTAVEGIEHEMPPLA